MCGIVGIVSLKQNQLADELVLKRMTDSIAHRGPDGEGFFINENKSIGFGHRRLSIIDLSDKAKQPMHYLNNRFTITFNGEIYNYNELRNKLIKDGCQFTSHSDTEILLALYHQQGEKFLNMLDGMFAFAIWDELEQTLFCARDRFGEKPFYFFCDEDKFLFASEIKALAKAGISLEINMQMVSKYLHDGFQIPDSETYFKNIFQLPASHALIIKNGKVSQYRYYDFSIETTTYYRNPEDYTEHFLDLFIESIKARMVSDVEVASLLSGGIDSSCIVAILSKIIQSGFKTFSVCFDDKVIDESPFINDVAAKSNCSNYKIYPGTKDLIDEAEFLIRHQEYPVLGSNQHAQLSAMKLAHNHNIKVLLDGQGADELLAGYTNLKYFALYELYRKGKLKKFKSELSYFNKSFPNAQIGKLFLIDPILNVFNYRRKIFDKGFTFKERLKYALQNELTELLRYGDRSSMAYSVEVRLPFLYHKLVEYIFSLPNEQIYSEGKTKWILRQSCKNELPETVFNRTDKLGFRTPQQYRSKLPELETELKWCNELLLQNGLTPSADDWRTFSAATFLKVFLKADV